MIIRIPCPDCGTVSDRPPTAVVLLRGSVLFCCPACAAVGCVALDMPSERSGHPEAPRPGPALTADDLIDFHLRLNGRRRLGELGLDDRHPVTTAAAEPGPPAQWWRRAGRRGW